jgi:Family of unknown function (DUF6188)
VSGHVVGERDGEFVLPLAGLVCTGFRHRVDGVELLFDSEDWQQEARIVINNDEYTDDILPLVAERTRVERAIADGESTLEVFFDDGGALKVDAGEHEAWEVQGPGSVHVVSPAGGGAPVIWDASTETYMIRPGDPLPSELVEMIESLGMPMPTGEFELRRSKDGKSFELGSPESRKEN